MRSEKEVQHHPFLVPTDTALVEALVETNKQLRDQNWALLQLVLKPQAPVYTLSGEQIGGEPAEVSEPEEIKLNPDEVLQAMSQTVGPEAGQIVGDYLKGLMPMDEAADALMSTFGWPDPRPVLEQYAALYNKALLDS